MKQVFVFCSLFLVFFSSCAARIDGNIAADGSSSFDVNMSLHPRMTAMIRSFSAAAGQSGNELDGQAIARSMSNAPGVSSVRLTNTSSSAVTGQIRISRVNDFLSVTRGSGFVVFEQTSSGGKITININRSNGAAMLSLLSPQVVDYFNALMAPIATGEEISKDEYLDIVAGFYSKAISDEIANSKIQASIEFPGRITNARGGTFSGRRANFDIPLLDLLVLETPLTYEVTWN